MNNVTINQKKFGVSGDTPLKLNNGSLVLHYNPIGEVIGAYLVTSFRDNKNKYQDSLTTSYCSFVNLDNGYLKFEERCSRNTTVQRVLSHLNPEDYWGKRAVSSGQYVKVYSLGDYNIDIITSKEVLD